MSRMRRAVLRAAAVALSLFLAASAAAAQTCAGPDGFPAWLAAFRQQASASGISERALSALDDIHYDQSVINSDRRQGVFSQSFLEFSDRMVAPYRLTKGAELLKNYAGTFVRIEEDYGVPGPVIVAFWGLETDFGANLGKAKTIQALATLAYDCRRPDMFRDYLLAALKLLDHGDLTRDEMVGAWAGELGQTQFVPTDYLESAVDYDGDGRRDLVRSVPDVLASTANLLVKNGWRRGEPWLEEARVPANLPWDQADLAIRHPRSKWGGWGVTKADGSALPADGLNAALLLPMGRLGPAFLAYPNFDVYTQWNHSLVYATTAAYFATRLDGAPKVRRGSAKALSTAEMKEIQQRLEALGHDVGGVDGTLGQGTRAAVKAMQVELGLPADSYPTAEFIARLRAK
jgi:lytic murein transglycosylase